MKKYKRLCFIFLFFPFFVSANETESTFFTCYKKNENAVQVTACLDNALRSSNLKLNKLEQHLVSSFFALGQLTGSDQVVSAFDNAKRDFKTWKESHCRMVESSFQLDASRQQAYLSCLIDLTEEQYKKLMRFADMNL